ncbi:PP2C family protein-serine/threonine phosphatase [Streptomyces sp. TR02-1]|uniref:PP2C family protein-serine/threonine phosphatase n=1 Tax=Streptomyces sp. TR02-1 TaxID=3385977 RepID=UPI0039A12227
MPSSHPAEPPEAAEDDFLDALITQTDRLRTGIEAVRREDRPDEAAVTPEGRWQRALWDLAAFQADDLGGRLSQLREQLTGTGAGEPATDTVELPGSRAPVASSGPSATGAYGTAETVGADRARRGSLLGRVGSAEWNLLTDEVTWSRELYGIFGRTAEDGPLSLDELPAWVWSEDQTALTTAVTDCLVDGCPVDGEFRIVRPDGAVRTLHLMGEPVLDVDGRTASMWAVLRDVSELRRTEQAVRESRESVQRERLAARTERRLAVELQESALPPWRGSRRLPRRGDGRAGALELGAHYLPSTSATLIGGGWHDALELPGGDCLLTVGDLTGHGAPATSGMALLLGAVRGMSAAGVEPGPLMGHLNGLLDAAAQPALGSALCCRFAPASRTLTWSQSGHPSPVLFRGGAGTVLTAPTGVLLGATSGAEYGQRTEHLRPGDTLVLHTGGPAPRGSGAPEELPAAARLLELAPRLARARTAQECLRAVVEAFDGGEREDDVCVLVARVE